jgi:hypothetical protein
MKQIILTVIMGSFLAATSAVAQESSAPEADHLKNADHQAAAGTVSPNAESPGGNVADDTGTPDGKKEKSADNATFVDRDGDGINDGKEHRFRKKSLKQQRNDRRRMMRKGKGAGKSRAGRNIHNR